MPNYNIDGFVNHIGDWPHMSFYELVEKGIYPENQESCTLKDIQAGE